jgi:hypothetical protein
MHLGMNHALLQSRCYDRVRIHLCRRKKGVPLPLLLLLRPSSQKYHRIFIDLAVRPGCRICPIQSHDRRSRVPVQVCRGLPPQANLQPRHLDP